MNLLVDIGNTRIKWAGQSDLNFLFTGALVHRHNKELTVQLDQNWADINPPENVFVSNVAGELLERTISQWVKAVWGVEPCFVSDKSFVSGFSSNYSLQLLGVDRWLALLAVSDQYERPVVVADCGSAVTADVLIESGVHLGGLIMPGLVMMRHSLHTDTNALPLCEVNSESIIGCNTAQAISSGILSAICGMIDRLVQSVEQEGHLNPELILTGGDAQIVADQFDRSVLIEPNLVLKGLMKVANHSNLP